MNFLQEKSISSGNLIQTAVSLKEIKISNWILKSNDSIVEILWKFIFLWEVQISYKKNCFSYGKNYFPVGIHFLKINISPDR